MADNTTGTEGTELRKLRRLALLFLMSAVFFFPMILNPITFGLFGAESDAAALVHAQENLGALRILFTGIGVTELALGIALWLWGRQVSSHTPGGRGSVAMAFSWVALVTGGFALVARLIPWFSDAEQLASDPPSAVVAASAVSWVGFSLSFIVFGVLMIRGAMPTWLGVVWIVCGVLFWAGFLPLWFFVGSLTLGIWGLLNFRPESGIVEQVAAVRPG
jgi:hypothetical protein